MCGIFGVIFHGTKQKDRHDEVAWLFSSLAMEAAIRGTDATGLARIERDGYIYVYKNVVPSYEIVQFRRWWRPLGNIGPNTQGLLGHTRWGTHGANTVPNAHPFTFAGAKCRVVGTHNGIISNYRELGPTPPLENDSANLFYRLAETEQQYWPSVLEGVNGSFALAWSDGNAIYLARNDSSPCVLTYIEELDATVYASTEAILQKGIGDTTFAMGKVYHLPVGVIHRFEPGTQMPTFTRFKLYRSSGYRYGCSMSAWYDEEEEADEVVMSFPPSSGTPKLLPPSPKKPDDDTVEDAVLEDETTLCESCGAEHLVSQMSYSAAIRGYECKRCATNVLEGRCDWCSVTTRDLRPSKQWKDKLCRTCRIAAGEEDEDEELPGPRSKADAIECDLCSSEFSATQLNVQIFYDRASDAHVCIDCSMTMRMA